MLHLFILLTTFTTFTFADTLVLGTTSTTVNSGLMDYLLPYYTQDTGHEVKVITGGTGYILQQLERGDVEIAITHQQEMEEQLLAKYPEGKRQPFMYNHFILVGPKNDPAQVAATHSFAEAMAAIVKQKSLFISRGDKSGSHVFELTIWEQINIPVEQLKRPWYLEAGQDMGATLNMTSSMQAYMIADEGTWLAYANRSELKVLYTGLNDGANDYSLLQLRNSNDLSTEAAEFIEWLLEEDTLTLINNYQIDGKRGFWTKSLQ